nr:hypothetical protein [Tanacetum cinerariifolium]
MINDKQSCLIKTWIKEVLDESTVILTNSNEGTGTKPRVPDEVKESFEAKGDFAIDWGLKEKSEYSKEETIDEEIEWVSIDEEEEKQDDQDDDDDRSIDIKKTDDEVETDDEFMHGDEYVHDDVDEEMKDAKVAKTGKDGEEITDAEKTDAKKINTEINSLLDIQIQQEVPRILSSSILIVPVLVILKPRVLSPIHEIPSVTPVTTLPHPPSITNLTHVLQQQTTSICTPPITNVAPATTIVPDLISTIVQRVPAAIDKYLGSSLGDAIQKDKDDLDRVVLNLRKRDCKEDEDPSAGSKELVRAALSLNTIWKNALKL